jgi:hypothetical protein
MFKKHVGYVVLAAASVSLFGCGGDMDMPDDDAPATAEEATLTTVEQGLTRGDVDYRAWQWVNVGMLYCQVPNGQWDSFCGYTCNRTGAANTAQWNPYRSDCSGLVSWAWGVGAPGWSSSTIYNDTTQTQRIGYWDMQMGDSITTPGHTMIFHGWNADGSARVFQELRCGLRAQDVNIPFVRNADGSLRWAADGRTYWPTRKKVL